MNLHASPGDAAGRPNPRHFIIATAGHVDHGKSSLVKALTGTDPDRLPEEKARGITIELGFAHLLLASATHAYDIGIVDVPGHEDFVKNMVSGVGAVDLALFVVAADDGWMPQTEEHLQILEYLRVRRAVIALTKIDLATDEPSVISEIRKELAGTAFEQAPIVPNSTLTGRGLDQLRQAIASALDDAPSSPNAGKARLAVDRAFSLKGIGAVVAGSLIGGTLEKGQAVQIQPRGGAARIRTIHSHNREISRAEPGTRTALALPDLEIGGSSGKGIARGDIVTGTPLGTASKCLDIWVHRSARTVPGRSSKPVKDGALVRWHHGAANFPARIYFIDRQPLAIGANNLAELRFEQPVFALAGERFILRDWAEQMTLGGGVILDPLAKPENFRTEPQRLFLMSRAQDSSVGNWVLSELRREKSVRLDGLLQQSIFSAPAVSSAAQQCVAKGSAVIRAEFLLENPFWDDLRRTAAQAISSEHQAHPELPGLSLELFRSKIGSKVSGPELIDLLEKDLCATDFVRIQTFIAYKTHRPALPSHLRVAGDRIRAALAAKPLEPPGRKEIAPDPVSQQALRFLIQSGEAVELGPEAVLLGTAFERARAEVTAFLKERGKAAAGELRQVLGSSRRIVIPLLEKLDQLGITKRSGDFRSLRSQPLD